MLETPNPYWKQGCKSVLYKSLQYAFFIKTFGILLAGKRNKSIPCLTKRREYTIKSRKKVRKTKMK